MSPMNQKYLQDNIFNFENKMILDLMYFNSLIEDSNSFMWPVNGWNML